MRQNSSRVIEDFETFPGRKRQTPTQKGRPLCGRGRESYFAAGNEPLETGN